MAKNLLALCVIFLFVSASFFASTMEKEDCDAFKDELESSNNVLDFDAFNEIRQLAQAGRLDNGKLETLLLQGLEFSRLQTSLALADDYRVLVGYLGPLLVEYGFIMSQDVLDDFKVKYPFMYALALYEEEKVNELVTRTWKNISHEERRRIFRIASGQGLKDVVENLIKLLIEDFENRNDTDTSMALENVYQFLSEGLVHAIISGSSATVKVILECMFNITKSLLDSMHSWALAILNKQEVALNRALRFATTQGHVTIVSHILNASSENSMKLKVSFLNEHLIDLIIADDRSRQSGAACSLSRLSATLKKRYHAIRSILTESEKRIIVLNSVHLTYFAFREACIVYTIFPCFFA